MRPDLARVVVVGSSCAGKTTLARSLARRSRVPHTELDSLYWGPGWTPVPPEEFRSRVRDVAAEPSWIVDGNYSVVRDIVWSRATALIWLGLSFPLVFSRALRRTFERIATQEKLFAGNTGGRSTSLTPTGSRGGCSGRSGSVAASTLGCSGNPLSLISR